MIKDFPGWIEDLFLQFAIAYEGLWTYALKTDADLLGKKLLWYGQIQGFKDEAIRAATKLAISSFEKPPSIKEFIDLCSCEQKRLKPFGPQLEDKRRAPPSPLLAEYMAKNPPREDDDFKIAFQKFKGKELGAEMMRLIRKKLGVKVNAK